MAQQKIRWTIRQSARGRIAGQRGSATLWFVLLIVMMMAFVVLTVDVLYAVRVGRQLSAGADAASLAGAIEVRRGEALARDRAVALALANAAGQDAIVIDRNETNNPAGNVVVGYYDRTARSFSANPPPGLAANAVHVDAPRTAGSAGGAMPTVMGSLLGVNEFDIVRSATAMVLGDVGPGVIALHPSASCTFDMRGTSGSLVVQNGAIVINSTHNSAACHSGQPTLITEELHVVGGTDHNYQQVRLTGQLFENSNPVPDPLAALPEPNAAGLVNRGNFTAKKNGNAPLQPGIYGDITINNGSVVFNAGLYYITGEMKVNGGNIDASAGVMLFVAPGGNIDVAGNGTVEIVGMSPTVYPNGPAVPAEVATIQVPIFQSRSNSATAEFNGTGTWDIDGTIYVPNGHVEVGGNPGTFANGLIAGTIEKHGNNDIVIDFEDQFGAIPRKVFLVE